MCYKCIWKEFYVAVLYGYYSQQFQQPRKTFLLDGIQDFRLSIHAFINTNIVVSEGDLLDMRTNNVSYAYIQGRKLNLDGKHQFLFNPGLTKGDKIFI